MWRTCLTVSCSGDVWKLFLLSHSSFPVFVMASSFDRDISSWQTGAVTTMQNSKLFRCFWKLFLLSPSFFPVFHGSGFTRTLCGGAWLSLTGILSAFNKLGSSTAQYGCCDAGTYMAKPTLKPFSKATACEACHIGTYEPVQNDDTSCNACDMGKYGDQTGQSSANACTNCGTGKYGNQTGLSACKDCVAGYVSGIGSTNCAPLSGQATADELRLAYRQLNRCPN